MLDCGWLHVNHGSFGAAPRVILEVQREWRRHMEAVPSWFVFRVLPDALRSAAETLGAFIGAEGQFRTGSARVFSANSAGRGPPTGVRLFAF
jgi:isopenicillin-N epimerase